MNLTDKQVDAIENARQIKAVIDALTAEKKRMDADWDRANRAWDAALKALLADPTTTTRDAYVAAEAAYRTIMARDNYAVRCRAYDDFEKAKWQVLASLDLTFSETRIVQSVAPDGSTK